MDVRKYLASGQQMRLGKFCTVEIPLILYLKSIVVAEMQRRMQQSKHGQRLSPPRVVYFIMA